MDEKISHIESDLKQYFRNKVRLCFVSESILAAIETNYQHLIPLTLYSYIPGSDIRIGNNYDKKSYLPGLWDSCAVINTENLLVN